MARLAFIVNLLYSKPYLDISDKSLVFLVLASRSLLVGSRGAVLIGGACLQDVTSQSQWIEAQSSALSANLRNPMAIHRAADFRGESVSKLTDARRSLRLGL